MSFKMVVKFVCEYNGKDFVGFQRQSKGRSVQQVLEDAISQVLGEKITIAGSGRTDTGVHAREQVCSFEAGSPPIWRGASRSEVGWFKLCAQLNAVLPADVAVRDFEVAPDDFHARYSAKSKTYLYRIYISPHRSPTRDDYYAQIYKMPLFERGNIFDPRVKIEVKDDEIWFWVTGRGFEYREVRKLVGQVIHGKPQSMPAKGLTLWKVEY